MTTLSGALVLPSSILTTELKPPRHHQHLQPHIYALDKWCPQSHTWFLHCTDGPKWSSLIPIVTTLLCNASVLHS